MKKIIISHELWQTRAAVLRNGRLQDIYFDFASKQDLEKCFYKGTVAKVLPGIQTAFVDIDQHKAGFLHITEIDRTLAMDRLSDFLQVDAETELTRKEIKSTLDVGKIFKENEHILVQVIKEPIHEKGAKLTTCFTLPGRFVVLMPNIPQIGISRKIENREERTRLKEIVTACLPPNMGAIVRTTAEGRDKRDLQKDIAFLVATWKSILKKFKKAKPGERIYEDLPLSLRVVRDHFDEDVEMIVTDNQEDQQRIYKFVKNFTPEFANKIRFYQGPPALFDRFEIDQQVEKALHKKVHLKSGGTLIIESTEAMTVIDVNTGKFTGSGSLEETIFKTNVEAVDEVVTQLRLRNIGGLIVIDFIDMASSSNRQKLSRLLEKTLKERDKFQSVALKISEFGIVQMTRKRSGKTLMQQLTRTCPSCDGDGFVKSLPSISFEILRKVQRELERMKTSGNIALKIAVPIFDYLVQYEYKALLQLEKLFSVKLILEHDAGMGDGQFKLVKSKAGS